MTDAECVAFLQWALPRLHLRWAGFRRVRRQVCRRIDRRRAALGLANTAAYRSVLEATPGEWAVLDGLCRVTISRFARDHAVWSELVATDIDEVQLGRAATASFPAGALRELPEAWRRAAFESRNDQEQLRERLRAKVRFARHDVRTTPLDGPFDLVLCRNLAFTYFDDPTQREVAALLRATTRPGGVLVLGIHERLPERVAGWAPYARCIHVADGEQPAATRG